MVTNDMEENIQSQVLKVLQSAKAGLQMEDLADKLNLTRHTVAKYLEVLRAEGKIHYNKIGRTKIWTDISTAVEVRSVRRFWESNTPTFRSD